MNILVERVWHYVQSNPNLTRRIEPIAPGSDQWIMLNTMADLCIGGELWCESLEPDFGLEFGDGNMGRNCKAKTRGGRNMGGRRNMRGGRNKNMRRHGMMRQSMVRRTMMHAEGNTGGGFVLGGKRFPGLRGGVGKHHGDHHHGDHHVRCVSRRFISHTFSHNGKSVSKKYIFSLPGWMPEGHPPGMIVLARVLKRS
eukprot:sb/3470832/